jgi:hypothetical protein
LLLLHGVLFVIWSQMIPADGKIGFSIEWEPEARNQERSLLVRFCMEGQWKDELDEEIL